MYVDPYCRLSVSDPGYQSHTTITHQIYSQMENEFVGTVINTGNNRRWLWFVAAVDPACTLATRGEAESADRAAEALIMAYEAITTAPYREDE